MTRSRPDIYADILKFVQDKPRMFTRIMQLTNLNYKITGECLDELAEVGLITVQRKETDKPVSTRRNERYMGNSFGREWLKYYDHIAFWRKKKNDF